MNSLQFVGRVFNQFSVVFFRVFRLQSTGHSSQLQNVRIVCLLWELIFIGHLKTKDAVPFTIAYTVNKVDIAKTDRRWRSVRLESGVKLAGIFVSRARRSCPSLIERGDIALPSLIINEVKCV